MVNKRLQKAKNFHQKWLEDRGLTKAQIRQRRDKAVRVIDLPDLSVDSIEPLSNGFAKSGFVNTAMSRRFFEKPEVRAEIEKKAMSIGTPYNKAAAQYLSPGDKGTPKTRK